MDVFLRNNTGNLDKTALIEGFVIRKPVFDLIFNQIQSLPGSTNKCNFIIIGQRGFGKTTLLYRLKYAIEDATSIYKHILPVMFSEEQYNITELENFWECIAEYLQDNYHWKGIRKEIQAQFNKPKYEEATLNIVERWIEKEKKKIIVFIENIDVFFKKIGVESQVRLEAVLQKSNNIHLVASATTYFENLADKSKPFNTFFKVVELNNLTNAECIALLMKIGEQYGEKDRIVNIINKSPKRIESLRRLTGGVPRTISYLFQIFLDNENGKAIKDLYQLIDTLTFLYKAELDQLSMQQQKVIDVIARNWDAIAVKEIAMRTRYESKQVSAILNVLEKNQFIESILTENKNNLYRIKERFLNIWYLMRFGRKHDKENIVWLVRFYDTWCDKTELAQYISTHIKNLSDGKYDLSAAIDMGNTFLACENVPADLKYKVYQKTKALLPKSMIDYLQCSANVLYERVTAAVKEKQYAQATEMLNEIKDKDDQYFAFEAWINMWQKKYKECEIATEKLFELKPDGKVALRIANLNDAHLNNIDKAIKFYLIALDKGEYQAAQMLGTIFTEKRDIEKAIKYHKIAIKNSITGSLAPLAMIYFDLGEHNKAKKLFEQAIKEKVDTSFIALGVIYQNRRLYDKAIEQYTKSASKGRYDALINLGVANIEKPEPDLQKAVDCFEQAIEEGIDAGYFNLGKLYLEKLNNERKGIQYLNAAIEKKDADAAHLLAHHYQHKGNYKKSDHLFAESLRLGRKTALFCWTAALFTERRVDKKSFALELLEKHKEIVAESTISGKLEYAFVLLWNDKVTDAIDVLKNAFLPISEIIEYGSEDVLKPIVSEMTFFMMLLMAKKEYNAAFSLFQDESPIDLQQILKPVYYALMNFLKDKYPKEYLKAGAELKDTIQEVIEMVEHYKQYI